MCKTPEDLDLNGIDTVAVDIETYDPKRTFSQNLDPYEVLGVERDATYKQIKDAWRANIKTLHPDKMSKYTKKWGLVNSCLTVAPYSQ